MKALDILLVEDDVVAGIFIKHVFKTTPHTVVKICRSGEEAVEAARKYHPDLILMDIMLETEMDGIEAAHQIRKFLQVPLIYCTAYNDQETIQRAQATNPTAFCFKPIRQEELMELIKSVP